MRSRPPLIISAVSVLTGDLASGQKPAFVAAFIGATEVVRLKPRFRADSACRSEGRTCLAPPMKKPRAKARLLSISLF